MELILRTRINYGFSNKLFLILYTCVIFDLDIFKGFLMNFRKNVSFCIHEYYLLKYL